MSLKTLLYVSESLLRLPEEAGRLQNILDVSRERNATLGVTGALIAARGHFAQVLEGPPEGVAAVMDSIGRDTRHRRVTLVLDRITPHRQFEGWTMSLAYCGNSFYVDRHIAPLLDEDAQAPARSVLAPQLLYLIQELTLASKR
ncbi:BLUF domain-containing protein [Allosphingosinicella deserti]|uniref:Blue light sensor protein n=1 Tax=Allosphingosinicella deserti TaxID=2116704 RepID=A0A2P7QVD9_9SPHN|nr:BLUF domain-containing protein [Sphingomonas deserti]PSJ41932.1 blue light sensor protein [Sphingomonas deserti]